MKQSDSDHPLSELDQLRAENARKDAEIVRLKDEVEQQSLYTKHVEDDLRRHKAALEKAREAIGSGLNWMDQVSRAKLSSATRGILTVDLGMSQTALAAINDVLGTTISSVTEPKNHGYSGKRLEK